MDEWCINSTDKVALRESLAQLNTKLVAKPGRYVLTLKRFVNRGTDAQRRYYHVALVEPFRKFKNEQGEACTHDQAHYDLKRRFRQRAPVADLLTGEIVGERMMAGGEMSIEQWSEFIELCIVFLTDMVGLRIQSPSDWFDAPKKGAAA